MTDFKALRAKFQNDPDLANKLGQKPAMEIPPKPGSAGNTRSSPLPLAKREVKAPKPAHPTQHSPLARPQGHRDTGLSAPRSSSEKLSCGTDLQGSSQTSPEHPQLPDSFQHVLQIWEETLSRKDRTNPRIPAQRAANPAAAGRDRIPAPGSSQRKDALQGSGIALPQAPRGHRSSDGAEGVVAPRELHKGMVRSVPNTEYRNRSVQVIWKCRIQQQDRKAPEGWDPQTRGQTGSLDCSVLVWR